MTLSPGFFELDIAPRKNHSVTILTVGNLPYQHSMSQYSQVYTIHFHFATLFSYNPDKKYFTFTHIFYIYLTNYAHFVYKINVLYPLPYIFCLVLVFSKHTLFSKIPIFLLNQNPFYDIFIPFIYRIEKELYT